MINECVQGGIADTLTIAFYGLQMERCLQLHLGDEASPLPVYGWQMERYLQPYLQPCKLFNISVL